MGDINLSDIAFFKNLADRTNIDLSKPTPTPGSGVLDTPKVVSHTKSTKLKPGAVKKPITPPNSSSVSTAASSVPESPLLQPQAAVVVTPSAPNPSASQQPKSPALVPTQPKSKVQSPPKKKETKTAEKKNDDVDETISDDDESGEEEDETDDDDVDENDPKIKREKTFYLHELERLRLQGVRLTQKYTLRNKLHDIRYEFEAHKSNSQTLDRLKFMTNTAKWIFVGIEWLNSKAGPFLHLQGWSQDATKDMTQYYPCFEKLYQRYFRQMQVSPIFEFFLLVMGSAFLWHVQQSALAAFLKVPTGFQPSPVTNNNTPISNPPLAASIPIQPPPQVKSRTAATSGNNAFGKNIPIGRDILKPSIQVPVHNSMPLARQPSWLNPNTNTNANKSGNSQSRKVPSNKPTPILEPPPTILSDSDSDNESHKSQEFCSLKKKKGNADDEDEQEEAEVSEPDIDDKLSDTAIDTDEGNFTDEEIEP